MTLYHLKGFVSALLLEGKFFRQGLPSPPWLQVNAQAIGDTDHVGIQGHYMDHVNDVGVLPTVAS